MHDVRDRRARRERIPGTRDGFVGTWNKAADDREQLFTRFRAHLDLDALAQVLDRSTPRLLAIARHPVSAEATAEHRVQAPSVTTIESAKTFDTSSDAGAVGPYGAETRALRLVGAIPAGRLA